MAVGDTVTALVSKTNNSTLDIQPGSGVEWFVHTIFSQQQTLGVTPSIEIYQVDDAAGTNKKLTDTFLGGSVHGLTFRVTNIGWIQLKNISGSTQFIGYHAVITK